MKSRASAAATHQGLGALLVVILAADSAAAFVVETVARVGDAAPGFAGGTTITSFVEPPSINDAGYAALHVTVTGDVHAIYRWHRGQPLQLVAKGTDVVAFATGSKTLTFLETPIVDELGWVAFTATLGEGGRGMVVWQPTSTLRPVAVTGQTVSIQCEKTTFAPCDVNPVLGALQTMATFNDRKAAVFHRRFDLENEHELFFAGVVTTAGSPQGLFRWKIEDDGGNETFASVASAFMHYPGGSSTSYFNAFSSLAACGNYERYALVGIGANPPLGVILIDGSGGNAHVSQDRHYTVDAVQRFDLHCTPGDYSFAGARSDVASDHTQSLRGVYIGTSQVYQYGQSAEVPDVLSAIHQPFGQAMTREPLPRSVFAARISGGGYNGYDGVWLGAGGDIFDMLVESYPLVFPSELVNNIWAVHVGGSGTLVYHVQTNATGQAILSNSTKLANPRRVLTAGDVIPKPGGGTLTIESFWTLGGGFGDPAVTGTGADGLVSALNDSGQLALLVYTTAGAGPQRGTGTAGMFVVDLGLFTDDFESADVCAWSTASPAPSC